MGQLIGSNASMLNIGCNMNIRYMYWHSKLYLGGTWGTRPSDGGTCPWPPRTAPVSNTFI